MAARRYPTPVDLLLGDWIEGERDRIVATLCDWVRIPSMSVHPDRVADLRRSAGFTWLMLRAAGLGPGRGRAVRPP